MSEFCLICIYDNFCVNLQRIIMTLINPYPNAEHKVFKRTFLQQTEVNVKFAPALAPFDFRERIVPYAKQHFGYDLSVAADSDADHAKMDALGEEKRYTFDLNAARIVVGPRSYETFSTTILPLLPRLQSFLMEVAGVKSLIELSIVKHNVWPIKADNAYKSFTEAIGYLFKDESVSDMKSYIFPENNPRPVQLSKMWTDDINDDARLDTKIIAEVHNETNLFFELVLCASIKNIQVSELSADSIVLNDIIYSKFVNIISENVIDLMNSEA